MKAELSYCTEFKARVVELSKPSKLLNPQELTEENKDIYVENCILAKIQCESDQDVEYTYLLVQDIIERCQKLSLTKVVLCPYGHINNKKISQKIVLEIFSKCEEALFLYQIKVTKVHFGSKKDYSYSGKESVLPVSMRHYPFNDHFYTPKLYSELIEKSELEFIKRYQKQEISKVAMYIQQYETIIDTGCGDGRMYSQIKKYITNKRYIGIEYGKKMYTEAIRKTIQEPLHNVIYGDMLKFNQVLPTQKNALIICLQNTLSVLHGDIDKYFQQIGIFLREPSNNVVLSFAKKSSLEESGVLFYESIKKICGQISHKNSQLNEGILKTERGYISKWYSIEDIKPFLKHCKRKTIIQDHDDFFFISFEEDIHVKK